MTKKAFIHISDLHIAAKQHIGGVNNSSRAEKTWLVAQADENNHDYIDKFCRYVKKMYGENDYEWYLLVTGDIADSADSVEYKYAELFLKKIMKDLSLPKERVLLVPGNHDINRFECRKEAEEAKKDAYLCNKGKYKSFAELYKKIKKKSFPLNKAVVDLLYIEKENLLFVGINTNYKIGYEDEKGSVNIECFRKEIGKLNDKYKQSVKIAFFHHNIETKYLNDPSHYGSFDPDNWSKFRDELAASNFHCALYGNEHTRSSDKIEMLNLYHSDAGSFGLKDPRSSFKIYVLEHNLQKTSLKQYVNIFDTNTNVDAPNGNWIQANVETTNDIPELILREKGEQNIQPTDNIPNKIKLEENISKASNVSNYEVTACNDNVVSFQDYLMDILRKDNLFHQGHFHWGKSSRSFNWIDTISLLSNRDYNKLIQGEMLRVIEVNKIAYDMIVGVGIEGNILSSPLLGMHQPYTYLPYSYRYEEANACEKNMCIDNKKGKYKNVLVITDVVHYGQSLRSLFEEKERVFFNNVKQISVLSIFYTGQLKDPCPIGFSGMGDKVKFYSLMNLEVGRCPHGDNYRDTCSNYKNRLCEVFKFYNEH